jgi:RNA polymerase sigma-70 factor (ECF subfamily)
MFLAKIVRNTAFDKYACRTAEKRGGGELPLVLEELAECIAGESDVAGIYECKELERCINQFVKDLPQRDGNVFLRRYFFAESTVEIGKRYGLTENNVAVILSRTRKKLRSYLEEKGFVDEQKRSFQKL